jgi:hypothetical protein
MDLLAEERWDPVVHKDHMIPDFLLVAVAGRRMPNGEDLQVVVDFLEEVGGGLHIHRTRT